MYITWILATTWMVQASKLELIIATTIIISMQSEGFVYCYKMSPKAKWMADRGARVHSHVKPFEQLTGFSLRPQISHTQEEKFELPPCVSLVSAKLFIDLGVDPLGLLGLLTQAAGHHRLQRHRRSASVKDPTFPQRNTKAAASRWPPLGFFFFRRSAKCSNKHDERFLLAAKNDAHRAGLSM